MNADASSQRCITLTNVPQDIVGKHKGKATFHPGGKHLLISSENEHGDHGLKTIPGIVDNHDFWMIDLNTGTFTRITTLPEDTSIQYPRFSNDGSNPSAKDSGTGQPSDTGLKRIEEEDNLHAIDIRLMASLSERV